jgi:SPX domain protein involved in polyphosphate accumulation
MWNLLTPLAGIIWPIRRLRSVSLHIKSTGSRRCAKGLKTCSLTYNRLQNFYSLPEFQVRYYPPPINKGHLRALDYRIRCLYDKYLTENSISPQAKSSDATFRLSCQCHTSRRTRSTFHQAKVLSMKPFVLSQHLFPYLI